MHLLVSIVTRSKNFNKGHEVYELMYSTKFTKYFLKTQFLLGSKLELCDYETELDNYNLTQNFNILTHAFSLPKGQIYFGGVEKF